MPRGSWSTKAPADERDRAFITSVLMLMGEERLQDSLSRTDETYRCLYMPSFEHSTLVRADRRGKAWRLTFKQLSATGDLARKATRTASPIQAMAISRAVEALRIDGLARPDGRDPGYFDADTLAFESVVEGGYHVRFEEFPNQRESGVDLRTACWKLLCATGEVDGSWKLMRALNPGSTECPTVR